MRMAVTRGVALLRGINVGGKNRLPMADLRAALAPVLGNVETYIASGNVLFDLPSTSELDSIERTVEELIETTFGLVVPVVVRTHAQLRATVEKAPAGFGASPDTFHSDAVFLKAPLTAAQVMPIVELRDGVDQSWPGDGVLYFARLSAERARSRMSRLISRPEYKLMTIRNWTTTTRLLELLDGRGGKAGTQEAG